MNGSTLPSETPPGETGETLHLQVSPNVPPDALSVPPWVPSVALGFEVAAALLGGAILRRRRGFRPIAYALAISLACEAGRALLASRLDAVWVPYQGIDRGLDALDLFLTNAALVVDCGAIVMVLQPREMARAVWLRPALPVAATVALGAWLLLVVGYPSPWARGDGRAHVLAGAHLFALGTALICAVLWCLEREKPRLEHGAAWALLLAHLGLVAGPWSPLAGDSAYELHRPWTVVLFGLAWIAILWMEVSWIHRRLLSNLRSSRPS